MQIHEPGSDVTTLPALDQTHRISHITRKTIRVTMIRIKLHNIICSVTASEPNRSGQVGVKEDKPLTTDTEARIHVVGQRF